MIRAKSSRGRKDCQEPLASLPVEEMFLERRKFSVVRKEGEEEKGEERERRGPFKPFGRGG